MQLQASFVASGGAYGCLRLNALLRTAGFDLGRHRACSLMREHGLRAHVRRKWHHTIDNCHHLPVAGNVLQQRFNPAGINQARAGDITYAYTDSG